MELVERANSKTKSLNQLIIILSICSFSSIGLIISLISDQLFLKSMIPIILTACFIVPRLILISFGKRSAIDVWAVFTYTSFLVFIYSPLYHLITGEAVTRNLPFDFTNLLIFVAWTSVPIVPLFYLGGQLRKKNTGDTNKKGGHSLTNFVNIKPLALTYIIIGLLANVIVILIGNLGSLTGTVYVLRDFFSVGLILFYYDWASRKLKKNNTVKITGLFLLILIVILISLFNLDRGSRFFILIYSFWGFYIYATFISVKVKVGRIILIGLILLPLLTQYKLFKYSDYDYKYFYDNEFRNSISEQYEQLTPAYTLATDLGRYYIWMLYYQELQNGGNIDYQYGKTYIDAILTMFPSFIVNDKPPGMIALSHNAESGRGYYEYYKPQAAKIGGFWAEGYVNFGLIGVWISAILFGYILQFINEKVTRQSLGTVSVIIGGLLVTFGAEFLLHDLRLILWHVSKHLVTIIPLLIYLYLRKGKVR